MKISIVTTVKNGDAFLRECMRSVLRQQADVQLEYIVVDGGSGDRSIAIIKEMQMLVHSGTEGSGVLDVEMHTFFINDRSMYEGLAFGLKKVTGEAVMYINSDDVLQPGAMQHICDIFTKYPKVDWVTGYANQINAGGSMIYRNLPWRYRRPFIEKGIYGRSLPFIQQESCFWREKLHRSIDWGRLSTLKLAGDQYLWMVFAGESELHILPEYIGSHRSHGDQLSHHFRDEYYREFALLAGERKSGEESWKMKMRMVADRICWWLPARVKRLLTNRYLKI